MSLKYEPATICDTRLDPLTHDPESREGGRASNRQQTPDAGEITPVPIAQTKPQGVLVRGHTGLVIN